MLVLGIDPGSVLCGYGVIESRGQSFSLIEYGVVKAKKLNPEMPARLKAIHDRLNEVIARAKPDFAVFETMFYHKNAQSLIKLSQARAAAILSAANAGIGIFEYSPREIKKSVTGNGNASKEQVMFMAKRILDIKETPEFTDSTDALAAAICHVQKFSAPGGAKKSWEQFLKDNPGRILNI